MQEQVKQMSGSVALPFLIGGLIGGGVALIFAPRLWRVRQAIIAAGDKTKEMIRKKACPAPKEGGIYCDVPEGADICFDEKERT